MTILKKSTIDTIEFLAIANLTDFFKEFYEQLILALLIVLINSVVIPFLNYIVKKIKVKFPQHEKIIDEIEKEVIDEIFEKVEEIKKEQKK